MVTCHLDSGDTAWVSICAVLVMGMIPALAVFEAGMLRAKNALSILLQVFCGLAILTIMWFLFGYAFTFGATRGGVIGFSVDLLAFYDVSVQTCGSHSDNIPNALFALFQMMFAVISPLLMTGAFAERLKFKPYLAFIVLWELLVYYPVGHWIWGGGWLDQMGCLDFAGGIVIHVTAGAGSLVMAFVLGRRQGFEKHHGEVTPHNLGMAVLGLTLLMIGWFGFNAGGALGSGPTAVNAIICTQLAAASSAIVWVLLGWMMNKKPSIVTYMNGALSGLAGITPASGYVSIQSAVVIGVVLGLVSFFSLYILKHKLKVDDALDVSSVHGMTGAVGAFSIGVAANKAINPDGGENGWIYGNPSLMGVQLLGILCAGIWSAFVTCCLTVFIRRYIKASDEKQIMGLDQAEIFEGKAYELVEEEKDHVSPETPVAEYNTKKHQETEKQSLLINRYN
jgi:Amt family ammonium transporter